MDARLLEVLPKSLVEVAEEVGLVNALALGAIYGGHALYVPRSFPPDHLIPQLFGEEVAGRLAYRFGGGVIDLAKVDRVQREERDQAIVRARANSKVSELARRFGLSERQVWGILARRTRRSRSAPDGQLKLF